MTRYDPAELLIELIQRVPILAIDVKASEAEGDVPTIAYQRVIRAWQREAAEAVAEIRQGCTPPETVTAPLTPKHALQQPRR